MPVETRLKGRRSELVREKALQTPHRANKATFPSEILNLIVDYSSPADRVKIASLNRWLNRMFSGIIYRDIHIKTPIQLLKLFRSAAIAEKLGTTLTFMLNRTIFWPTSWEGTRKRLDPVDYLSRILQMTTSLRELTIYTDQTTDIPVDSFEYLFREELCRQALDPTFLPKLARVSCAYGGRSILALCRGRPLEGLCHSLAPGCVHNPALYCHPPETSRSRVSLHFRIATYPTVPEQPILPVVTHMKDCAAAGLTVRHLSLSVYPSWYPGLLDWEQFKPILICWAREIASVGGCDNLDSLYLDLVLPLDNAPLSLQHDILDEIVHHMPKLDRAVLGCPDLEWRRHNKGPDLASKLPEWTPRPELEKPGVLKWWMDKAGLGAEAVALDVQGAATEMQRVLRTRWDDEAVPSTETIQTYLLAAVTPPLP
ncbi:hypothetical protein RhiJN_28715 [Ceratobasidium sp. AG-Ba]|nr:hypothetical protein RhiJN_28715 [Ceratobasidium sp. AG-Ba]